MTNSDRFYNGRFSKGSDIQWRVVEHDYSGDYGLTEYVAGATQGEEIAVGYLDFWVSLTDEEFARDYPGRSREGVDPYYVYAVPAIIVPGKGVWLVAPVWGSLTDAEEGLERSVEALLDILGRDEAECPLYRAHMSMSVGPTELEGGDINRYYPPRAYAGLDDELTSRREKEFTEQEVDAFVDELLDLVGFSDQKGEDRVYADEPLMPAWLAGVIGYDGSEANRGELGAHPRAR